MERQGQHWYRLASEAAPDPPTAVVAEVAEQFWLARRTLNHLTDRHLFVRRATWFGEPAP